ncbi:MAG TPA: class I SAM-dependent rRNA methyltransferase [Candidatus Eisenbacteria bacterium]|nr:class I SAM-dependent rRNA methyltransferase [Candidatus Eisenbacteria bacterium]
MTRARLAKNQDRRIRSGHPWVFSNEIAEVEGSPAAGAEVLVEDHRGTPIGVGLYNPHSLIAIRLYSRRVRPVDEALFRDRIGRAIALRQRIYPVESTYRLIHGEGDFLPGLVVDRYGDYLSAQSLTAGIEARIELILDLLEEMVGPKGIVCRRDGSGRALEGLDRLESIERGETPESVDAPYEGYVLTVDLRGGQKTGEFLDQRENRKRVAREAHGKRVLDLYCHTGLFSIHCAAAGAKSVLGIDSSRPAIERARENHRRNASLRDVVFREARVEDVLRAFGREGERFDMIILDPPALVKSKKTLEEGVRKYITMNASAMRLLAPGGTLATATCSHHVDAPAFLDLLRNAAKMAGARFRLVETMGQSRDHPVLLAARETSYLTMVLAERIDGPTPGEASSDDVLPDDATEESAT